MRLRGRSGRYRGHQHDRGSSAVELAILGPALIILTLLIIQFALWFDAYHAALAAAREGDLVAREDAYVNQDWRTQAADAATSYYQGMDTSVLAKVHATVTQTGSVVSVTVHGSMTALVPLSISETVTGPIECFRTQVSQGQACG